MTLVSRRITRYISLLLMIALVIGNISFIFANEGELVKEKSEIQKLYDKYYEKGVLLQYVNKGETYFSTIDLEYPEAQNTQCAHFTNSFYTNEFGIKLANSVTKINDLEQSNVIKTILYDDWKKLVENEEWKKELLSDLQEGDIITARHPDLNQRIGHAMMVYEVLEDDAILIHSTGSNSKTDSCESEVEKGFTEGSIRKNYLSTLFEKNYVNAERDIRVARPLAKTVEEPANTSKSDSSDEVTVDTYQYKITYKNGIDNSIISEENVSGTTPILAINGIEPPEIEGHSFKEWISDQTVTLITTKDGVSKENEIESKNSIKSILICVDNENDKTNLLSVQVSDNTTFTALYEKLEPIKGNEENINNIDNTTNESNLYPNDDYQGEDLENNKTNNNIKDDSEESPFLDKVENDNQVKLEEKTEDISKDNNREDTAEEKDHQETEIFNINENNDSNKENIDLKNNEKLNTTEFIDKSKQLTNTKGVQNNSTQPKTGDINQMELYFVLMLLSITIIIKLKLNRKTY